MFGPCRAGSCYVSGTQGVALGWHVIAPSGRDPANGGFASLPQRGIHRSAQGNALVVLHNFLISLGEDRLI